ncbi:hypothetical protein FRC17_004155, partial [Serendipita sp. 399]
MSRFVATTGVPAPASLQPRQEIRTFAQDRELMELYLQGLQRFQAVDQQNPLSWFQIAGIHGRHRPYLALFEQALAKHVTDVANEYPAATKARYVAAAQRFRIPYWDWAANADLPDFISLQREVTVNSPTGSKTFPNPLYSYTFHPMYSNFDGLQEETIVRLILFVNSINKSNSFRPSQWEQWLSTIRYPSVLSASARSDTSELEGVLQNNRLTLRDRTYNLLTQYNSYGPFSNDQFPGPRANPGSFDSLESIHGSIHGLVGDRGHMGVVDYAAYDPVFWLHHAN